MAMNKDVLGKAIAAAILDPSADAIAKKACEDIWIKISDEIIKHIQNNAQVQPGIKVTTPFSPTPLEGVTSGPGVIK